MGEQPIIGISLWEVIVAMGNLLVLYIILKKVLFNTVKNFIDNREKEVTSIYESAENAKSEALKLKDEYEQNISHAKDKAAEILNDATGKANQRYQDIVDDADREAQNIKRKAETAIELEKKKAISELRLEISDLATKAAEKIIEKELDSNDHKRLVDDFISQVGE